VRRGLGEVVGVVSGLDVPVDAGVGLAGGEVGRPGGAHLRHLHHARAARVVHPHDRRGGHAAVVVDLGFDVCALREVLSVAGGLEHDHAGGRGVAVYQLGGAEVPAVVHHGEVAAQPEAHRDGVAQAAQVEPGGGPLPRVALEPLGDRVAVDRLDRQPRPAVPDLDHADVARAGGVDGVPVGEAQRRRGEAAHRERRQLEGLAGVVEVVAREHGAPGRVSAESSAGPAVDDAPLPRGAHVSTRRERAGSGGEVELLHRLGGGGREAQREEQADHRASPVSRPAEAPTT
jgi:hypothetical protein